jgi:Organic solute transporter Ostalpha
MIETTPLSHHAGASSNHWSCFRLMNIGALMVLSIAVVVMSLQLQYVTYKVTSEQKQIDNLLYHIQNSQQAQINQLNEKVEQEHDLTIIHMAGTFTLLTGLLTMFHMSAHLRAFHEPIVQRKVLAILWMSPIYATTSFFALLFPTIEGYLAVIKDFYEAYAIYMFLSFLIAVLGRGDRDVVMDRLAQHADHLSSPSKLFSCWYHPHPDSSNSAKAKAILWECQMLCLQFVILRPLTSIASFVIETLTISDDPDNEKDEPENTWAYFLTPQFAISMVQNISVGLAFGGLLKFYHAIANDLKWCQPFSKFLCIKGVVFMTFWQEFTIHIVATLHGQEDHKAAHIQNVLICLEMLFFAIAHWCVFPPDEWEENYRPKEFAKPGLGLKDFAADMTLLVESSRKPRGQSCMEDEITTTMDTQLT